jgi:hypothetical protein
MDIWMLSGAEWMCWCIWVQGWQEQILRMGPLGYIGHMYFHLYQIAYMLLILRILLREMLQYYNTGELQCCNL